MGYQRQAYFNADSRDALIETGGESPETVDQFAAHTLAPVNTKRG